MKEKEINVEKKSTRHQTEKQEMIRNKQMSAEYYMYKWERDVTARRHTVSERKSEAEKEKENKRKMNNNDEIALWIL